MIGIKGIGIYLPPMRHSNYNRMEQFEISEEFIREKIGFTSLARKATDEDSSDLCVRAWQDFQRKNTLCAKDVDCLIVCTQNPDSHGLPHTSAIFHEKLNLPQDCAVFDLSLGCSGFVYGLSIIQSFMES